MQPANRIALIQCLLALAFAVLSALLTYVTYEHQTRPDTLEHGLRYVGLVLFPLFGLLQAYAVVVDPLMCRVKRILRQRRDQSAGVAAT